MTMTDMATPRAANMQPLSPQEAIVTLLIAGARADGTVLPHEANQIEHTTAGMMLFCDYGQEALQSMVTATMERMRQQGSDAVVRTAAAAIPAELRPTAFAMTVDLLLADRRSRGSEQRFTETLRALLGVDDRMAERIVEVLAIKNAG